MTAMLNEIKIVPKESATMGAAGTIRAGIHANHSDMCKFGGRDDAGYERVMGYIRKHCIDSSKSSG